MQVARIGIAGPFLMAVVAAAYFLFGATKALTAHPRLPEVDVASLGTPMAAETIPVMPMDHFSVIQERNIFKAAMPEAPETTSIESLPIAQLGAKLLGTIHCEVPPLSRAIILEGDKQRLVKVGDSLGGYAISEVQRRALVLAKGGEKTVLLIELEDSSRPDGMGGGI